MTKGITYNSLSDADIKVIIREKKSPWIFQIIESAFLMRLNTDDVIMPEKTSQIFDTISQDRINCMPGAILSENVAGVKWVSVFPSNASRGKQNVSGIITLSEIESGYPIAVLDGTLLTNVRTAAVGAVASKYLAPATPSTIGFIGAGQEARMHFALLKGMHPSITTCHVSSRTLQTEEDFISALSQAFEDVNFVACHGDNSKAAVSADIVVTAVSCQKPLLKAKDLKNGALYIHVGGWEDEYDVALKCDKIVCDEWDAVKHRAQTLCRMYQNGLLTDNDIYADLKDIISGKKPGREADQETIYFNSVGLSFIDIHLANAIYLEALKRGLGKKTVLTTGEPTDYTIFK